MQMPDNRVQGFLAAGHLHGDRFSHYSTFVDEFKVPVVVTGFEPLDLLTGLTNVFVCWSHGGHSLRNQYPRSARLEGNMHAQRLIAEVYRVATVPWRGFGLIPRVVW